MIYKGFSSNLWVWSERFRRDGREWNFDVCMEECRKSGLTGIELDSNQLQNLSKQVLAADLVVSASYIGLQLHERGLTEKLKDLILPVAETLSELKGTDLLVNADTDYRIQEPYKTDDDFKRQGEHLTLISELVQPYGIRTAMHNHAASYEHSIGDLKAVTEYSSAQVGLCVDTGWALSSDCNPLDWIKKYPKRIYGVHLRNQFGSIPTEDLLEGDISMSEIVNELKACSYSGWLSLELWHRSDVKVNRSMIENYQRSINYLKTLM
ncbi:sugar phosphate isomerase/epimerase family protein [Paenibacillus endoradicis]|uniref:sugar phosphate isomerase/epimerase family protein n=1 Tax=Paenibacillus endoradicis TaxID=2972487 RepID=UPI0021594363|nr:sugar phosphate isomerase/epimerase [Paenibacillus endoradicis]MCR8657153.1 sugar phosphate isomerase/epimerase [Paenibacillus endoradicis]